MITGIRTEVGSALYRLIGTTGPEDEVVPAGSQNIAFSLLAFGGEHASAIFAFDSADFMRANIEC